MTRSKNKPLPQVDLFFPSIQAALANMTTPYTIEANADRVMGHMTKDWSHKPDWLGVPSFDAFKALLIDGYPEGRAKIEAFYDQVKATLPRALGHNRTKVKTDSGDEFDYHAMLKGNNDRAWSRSTRCIKAGSGILRLVVNIGGNAHTSSTELSWRGVAASALTKIMVKAGYSVEIVAAFAAKTPDANNTMNATISTIIKPRTSPIDLDQLAALTTIAGFFRTAGFASIIRACDNMGKVASCGMGHYLDVSGVLPVPDKVTQLLVSGDVVDEQSAVDWVRQSVTLLQGARA